MNRGSLSQDGKIFADSREPTPGSYTALGQHAFTALKIERFEILDCVVLVGSPHLSVHVSHRFFTMGRHFGGLVSWRRGYTIKNNDVTDGYHNRALTLVILKIFSSILRKWLLLLSRNTITKLTISERLGGQPIITQS